MLGKLPQKHSFMLYFSQWLYLILHSDIDASIIQLFLSLFVSYEPSCWIIVILTLSIFGFKILINDNKTPLY